MNTIEVDIGSEEKGDGTTASQQPVAADNKTTSRRPEEFPEDIRAFFGHPLTAATTAVNGDALALLHEYNNLPAIERNGVKIGETTDFLNTILSGEDGEQPDWPRSSVEEFFNNNDKTENKENEKDKNTAIEMTIKSEPQSSNCCLVTSQKEDTEEAETTTKLNETTKKILFDKIQKKRRALSQSSGSPASCSEINELDCGAASACPIKKDGFLQQLSDDMNALTPVSVSTTTNSPNSDVFTSQNQSTESFSAIDETIPPPVYQWSTVPSHCHQVSTHVDTNKPNDFYYNNFPQGHYGQQCYGDPMGAIPKYADLTNYKPSDAYVTQQQSFNHGDTAFPAFYAQHTHSNIEYNSKSPDSGIGDPCMSPVDPPVPYHNAPFNYNTVPETKGREKVLKRRRSSQTSVRQMCYQLPKHSGLFSGTTIPKLDYNTTGYRYTLETPISTSQRIDEDRMTYLNKGQFYTITFENVNRDRIIKSPTVKSVISVVFREDKTIDEELKAWEFWHSRQHSLKQRVLDIDSKNSENIRNNCIEELALNCVSVRWDPKEGPAKLSMCVNCLSTDFSNQKGVKGLPLHVQIDTFEDMRNGAFPVHRSYCQIKVFCDKGAERKTRDEEKRKDFKEKVEPRSPPANGRRRQEEVFHPLCERSEFYSMADLQNRPLLFNPVSDVYRQECGSPLSPDMSVPTVPAPHIINDCVPAKKPRVDSFYEPERVLLYVREHSEAVFTALLLVPPTLTGLAHAIQEKYGIAPDSMKTIYKRSKKGILVKMDDNIIRHYSDESMFVIEIVRVENTTHYEITLAEIDVA